MEPEAPDLRVSFGDNNYSLEIKHKRKTIFEGVYKINCKPIPYKTDDNNKPLIALFVPPNVYKLANTSLFVWGYSIPGSIADISGKLFNVNKYGMFSGIIEGEETLNSVRVLNTGKIFEYNLNLENINKEALVKK